MNDIDIQAFREAAMPLMEWLRDNMHPHVTVIVDSGRAELMEGLAVTLHRGHFDNKEEAK